MQVKVASPKESGRILAHENVYFSNGNYDRRSSKLANNENAKCRVVFERSYSYLRLSPAWSKIARTSVKVGKTRLLPLVQLRTVEQGGSARYQLITRPVSDDKEFLRFNSLRSTGAVASERYYTAWRCCLSIFTKTKASHHKQRPLYGSLCRCFTSSV